VTAQIISFREAREARATPSSPPEIDPSEFETFRLLAKIAHNLGLPPNPQIKQFLATGCMPPVPRK
jgi:hypothetical protein